MPKCQSICISSEGVRYECELDQGHAPAGAMKHQQRQMMWDDEHALTKCQSACYFEEVDDLRHACELEAGHPQQHFASGNNGDGFTWNDASACVFTEMIGRTCMMLDGKEGSEKLKFSMRDGSVFRFWYEHDRCASCSIVEVIGDLNDLVGEPLLEAEVISRKDHPEPVDEESFTWTFYKFRTSKGAVTVRWLGTSNGYYSESVSFEQTLRPRTNDPIAPSALVSAEESAATLEDEFEKLDRLVH
jgi:hypothetical protein